MLKLNFGKKLKYLRNKYNFSQEELAKRIGIQRSHLARIETGANVSESTLEKILFCFKSDTEYLLRTSEEDKTKLFQLSVFNVSKKLFSSREAVQEFNMKKTNREIYVFPDTIEKFKGKPLYAYEMPDESLDKIIGVKDIVLVLFDDKIKPSRKNDAQILAVEFAGGIKALKLFNYPDEFQDCSQDELDDTQETYNIKDIKRIIGVAAGVISYKSLLPHVSVSVTV